MRYPCEKEVVKKTSEANQKSFPIIVLQGDNDYADFCVEIANTEITGIPEGPRGSQSFTCKFRIDEDGILHLSAHLNSDMANSTSLVIKDAFRMSPEELSEAKAQAQQDRDNNL